MTDKVKYQSIQMIDKYWILHVQICITCRINPRTLYHPKGHRLEGWYRSSVDTGAVWPCNLLFSILQKSLTVQPLFIQYIMWFGIYQSNFKNDIRLIILNDTVYINWYSLYLIIPSILNDTVYSYLKVNIFKIFQNFKFSKNFNIIEYFFFKVQHFLKISTKNFQKFQNKIQNVHQISKFSYWILHVKICITCRIYKY
jgi:hypothetical protein